MVPIADIVRGERKSRRRKEEDEVPRLLCFTITKVQILTERIWRSPPSTLRQQQVTEAPSRERERSRTTESG
jgi:hypothetical protein